MDGVTEFLDGQDFAGFYYTVLLLLCGPLGPYFYHPGSAHL